MSDPIITGDAIVVLAIVDAALVALFFLFRVLPWSKPGPWRLIWIIATLTAALFSLGEMSAILQGGSAVSFEVQGPLFGSILAMTTCFILAYLHGSRISEHALTLALTDDLTHLPNLRAFTARLDVMLRRSDPFSVAYIDLEGFGTLNDMYGSHRGDAFLKTFAGILRESAGPNDVIGRLGGNEFAMILLGPDTRARDVSDRVLTAFRALVVRELAGIEVDASIGIVTRGQASDPGRLLRLADRAMQDARRASRATSG
jgi:diguanylate cyclase (GGDEF)-like protein